MTKDFIEGEYLTMPDELAEINPYTAAEKKIMSKIFYPVDPMHIKITVLPSTPKTGLEAHDEGNMPQKREI